MTATAKTYRSALLMFGAVCLGAALTPDNYWKFWLIGESTKDLAWGTILFRVLLFFHGILLIAVGISWKTLCESVSPAHNAESAVEPKTDSMAWRVLFVLTLIAAALRFWNLNTDLWVDEVFTLLDFVRQPFGEMITSFPSQNQHLLFSILAHFSINIFGESAWALRLPAVLFGIFSIWALFFLCRGLLGSRAALWAAALMTFSYHHIWFSQNARGYTGLLFFTLLATWFWLEALKKNEWRWWGCYLLAIVGGMWVHMTMAFVVAAHGIVYLLFRGRNFFESDTEKFSPEQEAGIKPFVAWLLSVTLTAQVYAFALPEFLHRGLHEESNNSEWTNPLWVLTEIFSNLSIGFAGLTIVLIGIAFVGFGWWRFFRKNPRAALVMALPPLMAGSLMLALGHNLFPRFFFFAMGFGLLIVIYGAAEFAKLLAGFFNFERTADVRFYLQNGFIGLILIASITTLPKNYALPKQDYSGAKKYVESVVAPDDEVVAVSIAGEMYGRYFAPEWKIAKNAAELEQTEKDGRRIWLIYTLSPEIRAFRADLWRAIQEKYQTDRVFYGTLNGGEIFVCRQRNLREDENESNRNNRQTARNDLIK